MSGVGSTFFGGEGVLCCAGSRVLQQIGTQGNAGGGGHLPCDLLRRIEEPLFLFALCHGNRNDQIIGEQLRISDDHSAQRLPTGVGKVFALGTLEGEDSAACRLLIQCSSNGVVIGKPSLAETALHRLSAAETKRVRRKLEQRLAHVTQITVPRNFPMAAGTLVGVEQIQQKQLDFPALFHGFRTSFLLLL